MSTDYTLTEEEAAYVRDILGGLAHEEEIQVIGRSYGANRWPNEAYRETIKRRITNELDDTIDYVVPAPLAVGDKVQVRYDSSSDAWTPYRGAYDRIIKGFVTIDGEEHIVTKDTDDGEVRVHLASNVRRDQR